MSSASTRLLVTGTVLAFVACGGTEEPGTPEATVLPVFELSAEPTLAIGVIDGDEAYTFDQIVGVRRLSDGGIAVSDGGSHHISVFDADGAFRQRWAGEGEGPGEFRGLSRIYRAGADSLLALDTRNRRISRFSIESGFDRQVDGRAMSGDSVFSMDAWLHGRFWVEGGLAAAERDALRGVLDRLPSPSAAPGYRFARVDREGGLWIREPDVDSEGLRPWTLLDRDGTPRGTLILPDAFEPFDLGTDEVLGRWIGESDVHFVRAYGLHATTETRQLPSWLDSNARVSEVDQTGALDSDEFVADIRGELKHMASAQEMHYSQHYSYTARIDSLEHFRPSDTEIVIDFLFAGTRGWGAVFSHPAVDRICGLAYGFTIPAGWTPGMVMCAPAGAEASDR